MMMVPRAFLFSSSHRHGEEMDCTKKSALEDVFTAPDVADMSEIPETTHTSPVFIPPKRGPRMTSVHRDFRDTGSKSSRKSKTLRKPSSTTPGDHRPLPDNIASILEATAIPRPRRNGTARESRKLPHGKNHVHNFSKLLMDGVELKEDGLMEGSGNTMLDILLSPPEENEKSGMASDDDLDTPSFSGRSTSTDSMPSLDHDAESPLSFPVPATPSSLRSPSERRYRRPSHSEDCAFDHPLLEAELSDCEPDPVDLGLALAETVPSDAPKSSRSFPRLGSSFKSNLTASLRAIRSAAQTVSAFATPSVQPDDFLTRSLFTITPELTDDRRPPPMYAPPTPALRRYLNPTTISPAEMYVYNDDPHDSSTSDSCNCPVSIQMQTYHRAGSIRGGRKGGFHLAGAERHGRQYLPFNPEMPPLARPREPRENSDFLRMVVLEMNMRRSGKLRDDVPTRAKIWLPARKPSCHVYDEYDDVEEDNEQGIPSRWVGVSLEANI